ncbi:hypothetical protein L195_g054475 [Trifolium pratense]|uniref:Uncharacterized protein n=1 Tax=Trifolium pratense TaxID=57577 RepID=A0A2K3KGA1_TRIPR|nr:hypothetical protein L195_g054475 [Trifolium pratense]
MASSSELFAERRLSEPKRTTPVEHLLVPSCSELWRAVRHKFAERRPSEGLLSGKLKTCVFHSNHPKIPFFML